MEWCNGKTWLPVVIGGKGLAPNEPGRHCLDILKSGEFEIKRPCKETQKRNKNFSLHCDIVLV